MRYFRIFDIIYNRFTDAGPDDFVHSLEEDEFDSLLLEFELTPEDDYLDEIDWYVHLSDYYSGSFESISVEELQEDQGRAALKAMGEPAFEYQLEIEQDEPTPEDTSDAIYMRERTTLHVISR